MSNNFKYDVKRHEIHKKAAIYSYDVLHNDRPYGYTLVKVSKPSETGFFACALKKGNEVIIVYRGSDDARDFLESDSQIIMKKMPAQAKEAKDFCREVMEENKGCDFYVTGHSLGGALAQIVGAFFNLCTTTFNPAGVGSVIRRDILRGYPDKIVNYHNTQDPLFNWPFFDDFGTSYLVDSKEGVKAPHFIESMKPLNTAKLVNKDSYKSSGERLRDYQNRWNEGYQEIKSKTKSTIKKLTEPICAGIYYVNGYTRDDGTKVDGYTRTCGAKHSGGLKPSQKYKGLTLQQLSVDQINEILDELI